MLQNGRPGSVTFSAVTYKPFGPVVTSTGSDKFTYTGEMLDSPTGLVYLGARYYEPELGRFLSLDPLLGSLSSPQTMDRYVYCMNNPLSFVDPSGAVADTILDAASIAWDLWELWNDPSEENWGWLLLDVVCAAVPFLPAIGGVVKVGKLFSKGVDAVQAVDKASDAAKAVDRAGDFSDFFRWMDKTEKTTNSPASQSIFRRELGKLTGIISPKGMEAHHVFPKKFQNIFSERWGIDIWDPRYGAWVDASAHHHWSRAYNKAWEAFMSLPHTKSYDVFEKARELGRHYGFEVLF